MELQSYFDSIIEIVSSIFFVVLFIVVFFIILPNFYPTQTNYSDSSDSKFNSELSTSPKPVNNVKEPSYEQLSYSPKDLNLYYTLRGKSWTITTEVYQGLNNYLQGLPRELYGSLDYTAHPAEYYFIVRDLDNKYQKTYLESLVKFINDEPLSDDDKIRLIASAVQNIPYDYVAAEIDELNGKYPYEVLYMNRGVCGEKSKLLLYFIRELGYGGAYIKFEQENHAAVGIKCPTKYSYLDSGYCFIETTAPTIITDSTKSYRNVGKLTSTPQFIVISEGKSFDSASEEYNDSLRYNYLEDNHSGTATYSEYLQLREKYGFAQTSCDPDLVLCNGICYTSCTKGRPECSKTNGLLCRI